MAKNRAVVALPENYASMSEQGRRTAMRRLFNAAISGIFRQSAPEDKKS